MALNLEKLVFEVDTTQLEDAAKKIDALGTSLTKINKPAEKAAIASEKLAKAQADTATANAKAEIASAKAAVATQKLNKAQEVGTEATKRSLSIQERQATILEFMNQGYTKGQSSVLAYAKAAGEATDEIAKILDMQRKIAGGDPFDKSLSGIKSLKNELEVLTQVEKLYAQGADLTTKQVRNLSLDRERLVQRMRQEGATIAQIQVALKNLNAEYIALATGVNKIAGAEAQMIKSRKEAAAATKYLADADARLAAALDETNASLDKGATDALVKYEKALKTSGMSADEAAAKLGVAKKQFEAIADKKQADRLQYLARAISVQMGDVGISLASGMNPLLVMIQQGDQIRGAIQQAGASGKELEKAMGNAATQIATSFAQTGKAIGGFFVSAIKSAGDAILGLPLALGRSGLAAMGLAAETNAVAFERLKLAAISFGKAGIVAIVVAIAGLTKGLYDVIKQQDELTTQLVLTGASLGLNAARANEYANSMNSAGISTGSALKVISAMAKEGGFLANEMQLVIKAAVDLEKYGGVAVEETVKKFSKLKEKPVEALTDIAKATGLVSPEILKLVGDLERQGKSSEAAAVAMKAYADVTLTQKDRLKEELSGFAIFMKTTASAVADFFDSIFKNLWRRASPEEAIKEQIAAIDDLLNNNAGLAGMAVGGLGIGKEGYEKQKAALQEQLRLAQKANDLELTRISDQRRIASIVESVNKQREETLSVQEKRQREINKAEKEHAVLIRNNLMTRAESEKILENIRNKYKDEKAPAITVPTSKDLSIIQKGYNGQLRLAEGFAKDERAILKARFDAGLIDRAEYTAKDVALLQQSEQKQLDVIKQKSDEYATAYAEQAQLLSKAYGNAKDKDNREKLLNDIINLGKEAEEFFANIEDKKGALASAFNARELQVLLGYEKAIRDNNEAYKTLSETQAAYIENRKIESDLQDRLLGATGAEAVAIKAAAEEQKRWTVEIGKFNKVRDDALAEYQKLLSDPASQGTEALRLAATRYIAAMQNADKVIADSKLAVQNTTTDAVVAYYKAEFDRINAVITDAIVTALFEGGKAGSKKIRDLITAELKKPITVIVKAFVNDLFGDFTNSVTGGKSGSESSIVSTLKSGYDLLTNGVSNSITTSFNKFAVSDAGQSLGLSSSDPQAPGLTSTGVKIGDALGMAGNAYTGYKLQKSISGGYKTGESGLVDAITVAASAYFGPIAGAVAGVFNRAFGRKLTDSGVKGTFGGAQGFQGENFTFEKGGWLRSNRERGSELDPKTQSAFSNQFKALQVQTAIMADTLGQSTESIANFTKDIRLSFHGLTEAQIQEKIQAEFSAINESLAQLALTTTTAETSMFGLVTSTKTSWDRFAKDGETAVQALTRLSTSLLTANEAIKHWDVTLYDVSLVGADAASTFIDLFGGIEMFSQAMGFFYDNFFTEAEKLQNLNKDLTDSFAKLGLEIPTTREQFKSLVIAAKAAGDDKLVKNLTDLQYSFAELVPKSEEANNSLEVLSEVLLALLGDKNKLEIELLQVKGDSEAAAKALRALAIQGMTPAEIAAYDYNQSLKDQIQLIKDATATTAKHEQQMRDDAAAYAAIVKELSNEQSNLQIELLRAKGKTVEVNAVLRALATSGMNDAEIATYDYNRTLESQIDLFKKLSTYAQERKSLEIELLRAQGKTKEAEAAAYALATEGMSALERAAYDYNQSLRDQIQSYSDIKTATDKAFESLKSSIEGAISELEKSFTATDTALSNVEKAISAERDLSQVRLDSALKQEEAIKAVFDVLKSSISDIRGGAVGTSGASRDLITNAIKTGKLPDAGALSDAISNVRQSIESTAYVSKTEQRRASLLFANELESLQKIAVPQLSNAEQAVVLAQDSLVILDSQLKLAQDQVSVLRGIDTGILSVGAATNNLQNAILTEASSRRDIENLNTVMQQSTDQYNSMRDVNSIIVPILSAILGFKNAADTESVNVFNPSSTDLPSASLNTVSTYSSAQGSTMVESVTSGSGSVSELQALRQEIALMRSETATTAINTGKTARILDRATQENGAILVVSAV